MSEVKNVGTATDVKQMTAGEDYQKVVENQLNQIIRLINETNNVLRELAND